MDGNLHALAQYEAKVMSWEVCYQAAENAFKDDSEKVRELVQADQLELDEDVIFKYAQVLYDE